MKRNGLIALVTCCALGLTAGSAPQPCPPSGGVPLEAFVPENDGTGWALLTNGEPFYFAGGNFHALAGQRPEGSCYHRIFLGDAAQGYYIQRHDFKRHRKRIYRLVDGEARLYCEPLAGEPDSEELYENTYVARDGRVVSWNTRRVALWRRDAWSFLPAPVSRDEGLPVFLEHDGHISMVCALVMHVIDPDGGLVTQRPGWKSPTFGCLQWQGSVALRTVRGAAAPEAFDLLTGAPLPLPAPFASVREPITQLMRSAGGKVWAKTGQALYCLEPGVGVSRFSLPTEGEMEILAIADGARPEGPAPAGHHGWDVFFRDGQAGLSRWNAAGVERWDARHGVSGPITQVRPSPDRTLWFLAGGGGGWRLFRVPLQDPPPETQEHAFARWQTFKIRPGSRLMEMDGSLAFIPESASLLKRWDGHDFTEQPWPQAVTNGVLDGMAWDNQGHVYLRHVYRTAPHDSLAELGLASATVISDAFTRDPQGKMWSALVRAVNRGATAFSWPGLEVVITPEKKIWVLDCTDSFVRYHDGQLWRKVSFQGIAQSLAYTPRDGVVLSTRDNRALVYVDGVFEERAGIVCNEPPVPPAPSAGLDGTPLAQRPVSARYVDRKGNLWFWLGQEAAVASCRVDDLRVTARGESGLGATDQLAIRASVGTAFKNVRYEVRLKGEEAWRPLQTPAGGPAKLRFPCSGVYTCEVAAVVLGLRLPQTTSLVHTATVTLPETRLALERTGEAPLTVTEYGWRPPVETVPTSFVRRQTCEQVWRVAGSAGPWQPLGAGGRFPLCLLGTNGVYRLEFAAQEEGVCRDLSPVSLAIRLALDDEVLLLVTLDNLLSNDLRVRREATRRLEQNRQRWQPLLQRLEQQSAAARELLQKLDPLCQALRQETDN